MTAPIPIGDFSQETARGTAGGARWRPLMVALGLCAGLVGGTPQPAAAAEPAPVRIAIFDFELDDRSAGGGVVDPDDIDKDHLRSATEEARRLLAASNHYDVVDTGSAAAQLAAEGGVRHCNGCEGALARKLGAEQSMAGIITRVTRTEYTIQILVRDSESGELLANDFTGLRMGANYSWPRGVKWLVNKGILSSPAR